MTAAFFIGKHKKGPPDSRFLAVTYFSVNFTVKMLS